MAEQVVNVKTPQMLTIRQTAKLGVLTEHALRAGVAQGWVPHIKVGTKVLVNVDKLLQILNDC